MEKHKTISICMYIALVLAIVCSIAYLLMLGWNNVLLLDDYCWVTNVNQAGPLGFVRDMAAWQNRFSSLFVSGCIIAIWGHASNLIGYTILLLILGYASIYYALRYIIKDANKWLLVGITILITNVSIMAYFELSTFYWVCCSGYTLSTYATIALFTAILLSDGKRWARWIVVILSSLYLCGGAENFTPALIAIMGLWILYTMIHSRSWKFWISDKQQMMVVSLLMLCVGFVIVVFGEGTKTRALTEASNGFMGNFDLIPYTKCLIKSSVIFMMRLGSRGLYYLLLFPFGLWIGSKLKDQELHSIWKHIVLSTGIAFLAILISIASAVYGMGWYASLRAYSFVSFGMAALIIYWGIAIGRKYKRCYNSYVLVATLAVSAISISFYRTDQPLAKAYHDQIMDCHKNIEEQVRLGRTEPLIIDAIPYPTRPNTYAILRRTINKCMGKKSAKVSEPSHYFPYERYALSIDPNDWKNVAIQRYFNTPFIIIGWEEE